MTERGRPLISLTLHSGRGAHEDLVLRFWNGDEFVCDSYYLCIDNAYQARWRDEPWPTHQRLMACDLLSQWRKHIVALPDGDAITLPFDLGDQGCTFLRCRRDGDTAHLSVIGSLLEGYGVRVDDITHVLRDPAVLRGVQIPNEHAAPMTELLADVDAMIESLS